RSSDLHGYEGQGPEHSSARLERFLQLCAEDNMQVANCTTPANYFHILRRQLHRDFRKPLILMTPKSLLRHKRAVSRLAEVGPDTSVHRLLWDDAQLLAGEKIKLVADDKIRRVVLCSGKVYYDLYEEREKRGIDDVYLMRVEQLYPVPLKALVMELGRFKGAEIVWCQEEPRNMGAWHFIEPYLEWVLNQINAPHTAAPPAAAKPAAPPPPPAAAPAPAPAAKVPPSDAPLAPSVRKLSAESGVDASTVPGSGKDGRVTKGDMLAAIEKAASAPTPVNQSAAAVQVRAPSPADDAAREERMKMTRLRQTIARRLKDVQNTAAMLTTFNEVDMSHIMAMRAQYKEVFEKKHGSKLGFMGFFTKACVQALKDIPAANAEID